MQPNLFTYELGDISIGMEIHPAIHDQYYIKTGKSHKNPTLTRAFLKNQKSFEKKFRTIGNTQQILIESASFYFEPKDKTITVHQRGLLDVEPIYVLLKCLNCKVVGEVESVRQTENPVKKDSQSYFFLRMLPGSAVIVWNTEARNKRTITYEEIFALTLQKNKLAKTPA